MKKIVLKVQLCDGKHKKKAMKAVAGLSGVDSVSVDMKDNKLTLIGDVDAVNVVEKLRKLCHAEILTVGPAKEEKKKEEAPKKDDKKIDLNKFCEEYFRQMRPPYYYVRPVEEDYCSGCVIS